MSKNCSKHVSRRAMLSSPRSAVLYPLQVLKITRTSRLSRSPTMNSPKAKRSRLPRRSLSRMDSTSKLAHVFSKATSTSKYWVSRLLRITSSTKSRRFTAARALKSTISTSKSSLTRCSVRSRSSNRAILAGSRAKSSTLSHTAA